MNPKSPPRKLNWPSADTSLHFRSQTAAEAMVERESPTLPLSPLLVHHHAWKLQERRDASMVLEGWSSALSNISGATGPWLMEGLLPITFFLSQAKQYESFNEAVGCHLAGVLFQWLHLRLHTPKKTLSPCRAVPGWMWIELTACYVRISLPRAGGRINR